jgi:argininosuccinate lyase
MAKKLWGGRFSKKMNPLVEEFTRSIHYDKRLVECDLLGSMLHVEVLRRAKYLTPAEASKLYKGLSALHK